MFRPSLILLNTCSNSRATLASGQDNPAIAIDPAHKRHWVSKLAMAATQKRMVGFARPDA
jgi:hypothetical protein